MITRLVKNKKAAVVQYTINCSALTMNVAKERFEKKMRVITALPRVIINDTIPNSTEDGTAYFRNSSNSPYVNSEF